MVITKTSEPLTRMSQTSTLGAVIFDADDTLWRTQYLYDTAKQRFAQLLAVEAHVDPLRVVALLDKVDLSKVATMGFSRARFPQSMLETYEILCKESGRSTSRRLMRQILWMAESVFFVRPELLPDAEWALSTLRRDYTLFLYTEGDREVQEWKLGHSGLEHFFVDRFCRVDRKSPDALQALLYENNLLPQTCWIVGNSIRSDILPGVALGLNCIWLDGDSWAHDDADLPRGSFIEIHHLRELPAILYGHSLEQGHLLCSRSKLRMELESSYSRALVNCLHQEAQCGSATQMCERLASSGPHAQ